MRFHRGAFVALLLASSSSSSSTAVVGGFVVPPPQALSLSPERHRTVGTSPVAHRNAVAGRASSPRPLSATLEREAAPAPSGGRRKNNSHIGGRKGGRNRRRRRPRVAADSDVRAVEREIVRLGRLGRTDDALALYRSVWDADSSSVSSSDEARPKNAAKPTTRLMNSAIDACARARPPRADEAFRIWEEGMDGGGPTTGGGGEGRRRLSPNVFTFGALMSARARDRDAEGALRLLRSMRDQYKVEPNAVVYSTAISACERSVPPQADLALDLLREATQNPSVEMSAVGYNAALSALARAGEWKKAVRLLDEMEGGCGEPCSLLGDDDDDDDDNGASESYLCGDGADGGGGGAAAARPAAPPPLLDPDVPKPCPDEVTYGTVMAACERSEEWGMVLRYADALVRKGGDDPAFAMDGVALTSALHACQRLGRCDDALRYLDMMKDLGRQAAAAAADGEGGGEGAASASAGRATKGWDRKGARAPLLGPDAVAYRLAISACARSRDGERWADGLRLLREMRDETGCPPDVVAYTAAIGGCAEAGQHEVAFRLLERMDGEDGGADARPNVVTYNAAIRACATASARAAAEWGGDSDAAGADPAVREPMERALDLLRRMRRGEAGGGGGGGGDNGDGVKPDIVTYNAAIRACAEGMSVKGALDLMDELRADGLVPTVVTYGSLMTACERVGSVNCASKVFRMLKEQRRTDDTLRANEIIYGAAISCCRKAGQRERTLLLLQKMVKEGLSPNTATFNTVLMSQVEGKKPDLDKAAGVFKLMGSKYVPGAAPNRQTYTILVRAFAGNLRPNDAESFLRRMRADGFAPDVDLYTATVTAYERTRQPMKALRLMENMREDGYNFYDIKVLDEAFKKAIKLVSVVGEGLSLTDSPEEEISEVDPGEGDFGVDMLSSNKV